MRMHLQSSMVIEHSGGTVTTDQRKGKAVQAKSWFLWTDGITP